MAEIITALIQAGLVLDWVHEHKELDWPANDTMQKAGDADNDSSFGGWQLPEHQRDLIPLMFSLRAHKPTLVEVDETI